MQNLKLPNTIKMVITDFDGIITDGCVYIGEDFSMCRKVNFKDIMAFSLLKKNDYLVGIISGEKNSSIELLAKRFEINEVHQDIRVKLDVLRDIVERYGLSQEEYLYIGDDINDKKSLEFAKYRITVPNAVKKIKELEKIQITESRGGDGAFREVVDCLIG